MDWGFFRGGKKDPIFLRHKLLYPVPFYYFAAVTNLVMRLMWIVPLYRNVNKGNPFFYNQWDVCALTVIEAIRRFADAPLSHASRSESFPKHWTLESGWQ
jgi:hypothetical protein